MLAACCTIHCCFFDFLFYSNSAVYVKSSNDWRAKAIQSKRLQHIDNHYYKQVASERATDATAITLLAGERASEATQQTATQTNNHTDKQTFTGQTDNQTNKTNNNKTSS